jgi:hypothetical protein
MDVIPYILKFLTPLPVRVKPNLKERIYLPLLLEWDRGCLTEMTGAKWLNFVSSPEPIDRIQSIQAEHDTDHEIAH